MAKQTIGDNSEDSENSENSEDSEVPEDCDLLIISSPQTDFEKAAEGSGVRTEIERLSTYVENGGHLFVTLHSYLKNPLKNLESFLASHGISVIKEEGLTGTSQMYIKNYRGE